MQTDVMSLWAHAESCLQSWLKARKSLLISFSQIGHYRAVNSPAKKVHWENAFQHFHSLLIDYLALGHFRVLEALIAVCEQHHTQASCQSLYSQLLSTLHFLTARLEMTSSASLSDSATKKMLSSLSHHLAKRLFYEDKLIQHYRWSKTQASPSSKIA